jgi:hypothetical protein
MNHAISGWVWPTEFDDEHPEKHQPFCSEMQRLTVPKSASGSKATFLAHNDKFT